MNEILDCLCRLNFSKLEAQIYVALLDGGELSGYQIAKKIGASRSSVYPALEVMLKKGYIRLLPEETQIYRAQNPVALIGRLKGEFCESADAARSMLESLYQDTHEERFTNIKGFDTIVANVKEILRSAEQEVYMNTDFDLHLFEAEFKALAEKGIRVIVFSFASLNHDGLPVEFYTHGDPGCDDEMPSRMMIAADEKSTLVADKSPVAGNWLGTVTNNALMVSIVCEHIHNDIYLLRLKQKYGNLFSSDILLNTMFERK